MKSSCNIIDDEILNHYDDPIDYGYDITTLGASASD